MGKNRLSASGGRLTSVDGLYFRVFSSHQSAENQYDPLLDVASHDGSGRDWERIRATLATAVRAETVTSRRGVTRLVYRVNEAIALQLAADSVYLEQGRSAKSGAGPRPMFEQMKRDAALRKFDRLLVWKITRLGRDMREVISTAYELSDLGVTIMPIASQTGPINTMMGKLLWAIQGWYAEMENEERSENVRIGQARAKAAGKEIGRPREITETVRAQIARLRADGYGYKAIAGTTGIPRSSVIRILRGPKT
jgi:putative DNA-invertase from lambdoid prophage Rac